MSLKTSSVFVVAAAVAATTVVIPHRRAVELTVPGHSSAYPSITANGRFVAVAWGATASDGTTSIYTAVSRDAGRTFATPIRTNDGGRPASLSGEQPPTMTLVPRTDQDPAMIVTWTARTPGGTQLLSARSSDGGQSFTRPAALSGSEAPGNRGWQATAAGRDGHVIALWLDHRELAMPAGGAMDHGAHQHGAEVGRETDSVERAQHSKLFFARLDDPNGAQALTGGVCYCCKTALATAPDGTIYAAWRHVYPGSVRDIAFTASRDGGKTFSAPVRVSDDAWVLEGCPENGPSMTVGERQRVHIAWPTLIQEPASTEPTLALFYAESLDGLRFTPRQRVPTEGVPRHVRIASLSPGSIAMVWEEGSDGMRRVALGRVQLPGHAPLLVSGRRGATGQLDARRVEIGDRAVAIGDIDRRRNPIEHLAKMFGVGLNGIRRGLDEITGRLVVYHRLGPSPMCRQRHVRAVRSQLNLES